MGSFFITSCMGLSSFLLSLQKHVTVTKGFHMKSCKITTFHFDAITLGASFKNVSLSIFDLAYQYMYIQYFLRVLLGFFCMVINSLFVCSILCISFQHSLARSYFAFCTIFRLFKGIIHNDQNDRGKTSDKMLSSALFLMSCLT